MVDVWGIIGLVRLAPGARSVALAVVLPVLAMMIWSRHSLFAAVHETHETQAEAIQHVSDDIHLAALKIWKHRHGEKIE